LSGLSGGIGDGTLPARFAPPGFRLGPPVFHRYRGEVHRPAPRSPRGVPARPRCPSRAQSGRPKDKPPGCRAEGRRGRPGSSTFRLTGLAGAGESPQAEVGRRAPADALRHSTTTHRPPAGVPDARCTIPAKGARGSQGPWSLGQRSMLARLGQAGAWVATDSQGRVEAFAVGPCPYPSGYGRPKEDTGTRATLPALRGRRCCGGPKCAHSSPPARHHQFSGVPVGDTSDE
jgi:hypothetical protein